MAVKWKWNIAGFAALRNDPHLVGRMRSAAETATVATPFDVEVEEWPHQGHRSGPRTSVQIWAHTIEARVQVNRSPGALTSTLNRVHL